MMTAHAVDEKRTRTASTNAAIETKIETRTAVIVTTARIQNIALVRIKMIPTLMTQTGTLVDTNDVTGPKVAARVLIKGSRTSIWMPSPRGLRSPKRMKRTCGWRKLQLRPWSLSQLRNHNRRNLKRRRLAPCPPFLLVEN
jgi:hypothetical protein